MSKMLGLKALFVIFSIFKAGLLKVASLIKSGETDEAISTLDSLVDVADKWIEKTGEENV